MPTIRQMAEVTGICALYMSIGPALMILNKEIMDSVSCENLFEMETIFIHHHFLL